MDILKSKLKSEQQEKMISASNRISCAIRKLKIIIKTLMIVESKRSVCIDHPNTLNILTQK